MQIPGEQTYAVDFFRVSGGRIHQYSFNSNGRLTGITGGSRASLESLLGKPLTEEIQWLSNLRVYLIGWKPPQSPFTVTWENSGLKIAMTVLSEIDRLVIADAPGWRSDRGDELNAPPIQQILAERTDKKHVKSQYAAIIVPYTGAVSPVKSARLAVNDYKSGFMCIAVELEGRTDYIISSLDDEMHRYMPIIISGRFGFASLDSDGSMMYGYLLNGTELRCGNATISIERARIPLKIASVKGRTYTCAEPIPRNLKLAGKYILAGDTGYEIELVTDTTITVRDYPAVECDSVTILNSAWYKER